jgi:hypothetical protein
MDLASHLLKSKALTPEQLKQLESYREKYGGFLAENILELNLITPEELAKLLPTYPPVPRTFQELGVPRWLLAQLLLKHAYFLDSFSSVEAAQELRIPEHLVEVIIEYLKGKRFLNAKPRNGMAKGSAVVSIMLRYAISELGKAHAEQCLELNSYVGPAPVSLEHYWDWVEAQTIHREKVDKERLEEVCTDYVFAPELLAKVGPAINSGRAMFLFGPSGNGKTLLARCIGEAFQDHIFIPYALYVHGQIIRLYDEVNHRPVEAPEEAPKHDGRWVRCRRPLVIAGGEMTEDNMELKYNPTLKYYEAPHHLRANNGIYIIDDFGRQKIKPQQLLNRWMFPLETRQDFLSLRTGQQFAIPFDQLIIFCTNLNPYSLADEAFLRRIRHKIYMGYVSPEQFTEIFRRNCSHHGLEFNQAVVRYLLTRYFVQPSRPLCACHPRDFLEMLLDRSRFFGQTPQLTTQELDEVCQSYFVKVMGIADYDALPPAPHSPWQAWESQNSPARPTDNA